MGSISKLVGTLTGGLLGAPDVQEPDYKGAQKQKGDVDPNRGEELAGARKRKLAAARRKGRSAFRIDLTTGAGGDDGNSAARGPIQLG